MKQKSHWKSLCSGLVFITLATATQIYLSQVLLTCNYSDGGYTHSFPKDISGNLNVLVYDRGYNSSDSLIILDKPGFKELRFKEHACFLNTC